MHRGSESHTFPQPNTPTCTPQQITQVDRVSATMRATGDIGIGKVSAKTQESYAEYVHVIQAIMQSLDRMHPSKKRTSLPDGRRKNSYSPAPSTAPLRAVQLSRGQTDVRQTG